MSIGSPQGVSTWVAIGDLAELERMLVESGVGGPDQIDRAKQESHGLGLFVRSLVGLDRGAATLLRVWATAVAA